MRLYYCPDPNRRVCMVTDVPDDIGPAIDIGATAPNGSMITMIDHVKRIYQCADGTRHKIPKRYYQCEGHDESVVVVAMPRRKRYPFRWEGRK